MRCHVYLTIACVALFGIAFAQEPPASPPTPLPAAVTKEYKIGPEDLLGIATRDVSEATGEFLVRADGKITFPIVGEIRVEGMTLEQLKADLESRLSHELRNPEVTVNIKQMRQNRVYVLGSVRAGGALDAKPGWRLAELVAAAGGLALPPERLRAIVFRAEGILKIEMRDLFIDAKPEANVPIKPGDVVNIASEPTIRVSVVGEVLRPGLIDVIDGNGIVEAIAAAGGQTAKAGLTKARVMRGTEEIPVDLRAAILLGKPENNVPLKDGDTVYVPEHKARISVMGMVGKPGPLDIPDGEGLTFVQAIGLAGGPIREAKLDGITLARVNETGRVVPTNYNYKDMLSGKKGVNDMPLQDGDVIYVAQSGRTNAGQIAQILGLILSGGGLLRGF